MQSIWKAKSRNDCWCIRVRTIGLLIIQVARAMGATNIIATDKLLHCVDAAKSFGAHHAFLAEDSRELGAALSMSK